MLVNSLIHHHEEDHGTLVVKKRTRMMKKQNSRTICLICGTFVYLLIGAGLFLCLEAGYETEERLRLAEEELHFKTKYNITDDDYWTMSRNVVLSEPYKAGVQWKFAGSFFFSTTVITTIGYGHSTPKTVAGKLCCMLYALIGIPLNLVMFQSVGERINNLVKYLLGGLRKCLHFKNTEVSPTLLIFVSLNMSSLVVLGGAWAFSYYENWTYLDSFYYCFVTLTTVGFGDYVVLQKNNVIENNVEYVVFALIFILVGLAVVSAAMNLLILNLLTKNTEDEERDILLQADAARMSSAHLDVKHPPNAEICDVPTVDGSIPSTSVHPGGPHWATSYPNSPTHPRHHYLAPLTPTSTSTSPCDHLHRPTSKMSFVCALWQQHCCRCCFHLLCDQQLVTSPTSPPRHRYKVTRCPVGKVSHLLPMTSQTLLGDSEVSKQRLVERERGTDEVVCFNDVQRKGDFCENNNRFCCRKERRKYMFRKNEICTQGKWDGYSPQGERMGYSPRGMETEYSPQGDCENVLEGIDKDSGCVEEEERGGNMFLIRSTHKLKRNSV